MICEQCKKGHDGTYGSGRFCSRACANKRDRPEEVRKKISNAVNHSNLIRGTVKGYKKHLYTCDKCGKGFENEYRIKKERYKHCLACRRIVSRAVLDAKSIKDFSKRTVTKIMKRANVCCALCGWKEASCDIHHIVAKSKGGTNNMDNLIILCPNCHRKVHFNLIVKEVMFQYTLDKVLPNWKDFYYGGVIP